MEETGQLNSSSHAYRTSLSTTTTLAEICENIYQGVEDRKISEIMTVDQSAAFDILSHQILLDKCQLYGVGTNALKWLKDFLTNRSQYVKIGAASSRWRNVTCGVPQGSVLGPLLYAVYMNDITEAIKDENCTNSTHLNKDDLFGCQCEQCGELTTYVDDSTYHIASKKRETNQEKINTNLDRIQKYMDNNELSINLGKTKVLEMMLRQKRAKMPGEPPKLLVNIGQGEVKEIRDKGTCKFLGAILQSNITWNKHLENEKNALFPSLRKQLGALIHMGRKIPPMCRRLLAVGLIHSRISYLLPLWASSQNTLMRKAQVILNKAARWTSGLPRRTIT